MMEKNNQEEDFIPGYVPPPGEGGSKIIPPKIRFRNSQVEKRNFRNENEYRHYEDVTKSENEA